MAEEEEEETAAAVRCPLATVFGSDDLVDSILSHGGLGACAVFAQCNHSLALSASALVTRWAELTPLRTIAPEACDSLLNPSYMLALERRPTGPHSSGGGGLLVSSGCPSGGLVCRLLLFEADGAVPVRTLRPNLPRAAQFSSPRGLAVDASGQWLYVVDRDTNRILKMSLATARRRVQTWRAAAGRSLETSRAAAAGRPQPEGPARRAWLG